MCCVLCCLGCLCVVCVLCITDYYLYVFSAASCWRPVFAFEMCDVFVLCCCVCDLLCVDDDTIYDLMCFCLFI